MKKSISTRLFFIFIGIQFITLFVFWSASQVLIGKLNSDFIDAGELHLQKSINDEIKSNQLIVANTINDHLADAIYNLDFTKIENTIRDLNKNTPLSYIYVYDKDGAIIHDGTPSIDTFGQRVQQVNKDALGHSASFSVKLEDDVIHVSTPISTSGHLVGGVSYATKHFQVNSQLQLFNQKIDQAANKAFNKTTFWLTFSSILFYIITLPLISKLSKRFTYPIRHLSEIANNFIHGRQDKSFNLKQTDEIGDLSKSLQEMTEQLQNSNKQLANIAYTDELTGLVNRRKFKQSVEHALKSAKLNAKTSLLIVIDIDNFKAINDSLGHQEGDKTLQLISQAIQQSHAELGIENAFSARLGGDEFGIFLTLPMKTGSEPELNTKSEQILSKITYLTNKNRSGQPPITLSAGASVTELHADHYTELLKLADLALYDAKLKGKNRLTLFNNTLANKYRFRLSIANDFEEALLCGDFQLKYQKISHANHNATIGYECLSRWNHKEYGAISPETFIPILEKSGKIQKLSQWVFDRVIEDAVEIIKMQTGHPPLFSINLSIADIVHSHHAEEISKRLKRAKELGIKICLEITETGMMKNLELGQQQLQQWRREGADIWIDDFGTGYSSLSYLQNLPINIIKLDKNFVVNIAESSNTAIIQAVCAIAKALSVQVLAEGIETKEQALQCGDYGIVMQQGFLYAPPLSLSEMKIQSKNTTHNSSERENYAN